MEPPRSAWKPAAFALRSWRWWPRLEPSLFSEVVVRRGMPSLRHLVDKPVKYADAPDLFCLDLYRFTTSIASPLWRRRLS